jgi:hypothetical protein
MLEGAVREPEPPVLLDNGPVTPEDGLPKSPGKPRRTLGG